VNLLQSHYTYIILIAFTISGPFLLSFDKKVAFYKEWKYFLLSMLPTSLAYIVWDIIATRTAVWQFNKAFLEPIKSITNVIGWDTEHRATLGAFA